VVSGKSTNGTHVDSWEEELAPDEPLFGVVNHRLAGRAIGSISAAGGHNRRQRIERVLDKKYFTYVSGSYES